jgi:cell division protein FtsQ
MTTTQRPPRPAATSTRVPPKPTRPVAIPPPPAGPLRTAPQARPAAAPRPASASRAAALPPPPAGRAEPSRSGAAAAPPRAPKAAALEPQPLRPRRRPSRAERPGVEGRPETSARVGAPRRPPVDPRFRQRWVDARRAESQHRLRILIAAVAAGCLLLAGGVALDSSLFGARHVRVVGALRVTPASVVAAARLSGAPPLVRLNTGAVAARIEALPWVAKASVKRAWPDSVVITVVERTAVAQVSGASGPEPVDAAGRVLASAMSPSFGDLPAVVGLQGGAPGTTVRAAPPVPGGGAAMAELLAAASAVPSAVAGDRPTISLQASRGLVVTLAGDPLQVVLGPPTQLAQKFAALSDLLNAGVGVNATGSLDLTAPTRPALTPPTAGH